MILYEIVAGLKIRMFWLIYSGRRYQSCFGASS